MGIDQDGFGTLFKEGGGGGDPHVQEVSATTTNAVPVPIFQNTLDPSTLKTFRATITVTRGPSAAVVGKFVREFTVRRNGAAPAALLQDLVPSPDYQEDLGLAVAPGVDTNNATLIITGLAATLTWFGRVEIVL